MNTFALISLGALLFALVCAVGGIWALLAQQPVVNDKGQTEIELPFFGKMKTNAPALIAVLLGSAIVYAVITRVPFETDKIPLTARLSIEGTSPDAAVFVGAIPNRYLQSSNVLLPGQENEVRFQVDESDDYTVIAYTVASVRPDASFDYTVVQGPTRPSDTPPGILFSGKLSGGRLSVGGPAGAGSGNGGGGQP